MTMTQKLYIDNGLQDLKTEHQAVTACIVHLANSADIKNVAINFVSVYRADSALFIILFINVFSCNFFWCLALKYSYRININLCNIFKYYIRGFTQ